jgi:hypothetical protein
MEQDRLEICLDYLQPQTLAHILADLDEAAEDWGYYPEAAPPQTAQELLKQIRVLIVKWGFQQAQAEGLDFEQILDQIKTERAEKDWLRERNQQDRENWYSDYQ